MPQPQEVPQPGWFQGAPANVQRIPQLRPEIEQQLDQLLGLGQGGLRNIIQQYQQGLQPLPNQQQFEFEPIAQYARQQFQTRTVPGLAERFNELGGASRPSPSSPIMQALGAAGGELELGLGALRSQYNQQQQSIQNQLALATRDQQLRSLGQQQGLYGNLLAAGLAPRDELIHHAEQPGHVQAFVQRIAPALAAALGGWLGGPVGALAGGVAGGAMAGGGAGQQGQLGPVAPQAAGSAGMQALQQLANNPAFQGGQYNQPNLPLGIQNPLLAAPKYLQAAQR